MHPIDDPFDAETELGLPTSDYLPTPNGSVRLLHRGTIYYRDGEALQVFPQFIYMLDGRVVHMATVEAYEIGKYSAALHRKAIRLPSIPKYS